MNTRNWKQERKVFIVSSEQCGFNQEEGGSCAPFARDLNGASLTTHPFGLSGSALFLGPAQLEVDEENPQVLMPIGKGVT